MPGSIRNYKLPLSQFITHLLLFLLFLFPLRILLQLCHVGISHPRPQKRPFTRGAGTHCQNLWDPAKLHLHPGTQGRYYRGISPFAPGGGLPRGRRAGAHPTQRGAPKSSLGWARQPLVGRGTGVSCALMRPVAWSRQPRLEQGQSLFCAFLHQTNLKLSPMELPTIVPSWALLRHTTLKLSPS